MITFFIIMYIIIMYIGNNPHFRQHKITCQHKKSLNSKTDKRQFQSF